jgi:mannose-6-phosphate isomerase-like protein (cupin superfamily)
MYSEFFKTADSGSFKMGLRIMKGKLKRTGRRPPIVVKKLDRPDEKRTFEKGLFQTVKVGGIEVGRAAYLPGWRWSTHVGPLAGTPSCQVEHVGVVLAGRVAVKMDDGEEIVLGPGEVFYVPPGHDSWVVGDEPYVSIHMHGATSYAAPAPVRRTKPRRPPKRGARRAPARKRTRAR